MERISPTNDLAFKKVLASEENKDILAGLIEDFFSVKAEDIVIENPYSIAAYIEHIKGSEAAVLRHTLKDVAASFKTADFVSEVQVSQVRFFDERALYYTFDRFCKNYGKAGAMVMDAEGKPIRYSSLRPVFALNVLGYSHFKDDDEALRIFELYDPARNKRFGKELLRLGYFELSKPGVETVNQGHWKEYFTTGLVGPDAPEYIRKASRVIDYANLGKEEREVVLALEKGRAIYEAELVSSFLDGKDEGKIEGKIEGVLEGMVKGKVEGKVEVAKSMLVKGLTSEMVAEYTGLPLAQVKALAAKK